MRILAAIDLTDTTTGAIVQQAARWAERLGATLDLAYVDQNAYDTTLIHEPAVRAIVVEEWEKIRARHQGEIEALLAHVPDAIRGTCHFRVGPPANEILELAVSYDAIVVATHGRTGLGHVLIGSVAERIVRRAPCPVIVLRAPDKR